MSATSHARVRHLSVVRAPAVYQDRLPTGYVECADGTFDEVLTAGRPPDITAEPQAHERWLACARPDERLRYGAYLCDCATCRASIERAVRVHRRPGLAIVIVTEADRITTSAREVLAQLELGDGYASMLWVPGDVVRDVYVGRGTSHRTVSEAQYNWQARCARDGRYLPRPRLETAEGALETARHPASLGPTSSLTLRLPRDIERAARDIAAAADLELETWIAEALKTSIEAAG